MRNALNWPLTDGSPEERRFMRRALRLAKRGAGMTAPNPPVGAVIVRDGVILGEGLHRCAGQPHAEVEAVSDANCDLAGATLYVTLEPCSTHGRTPPCTDLIIRSNIERVVIAVDDPNPLHAGGGMKLLESAGIRVVLGVEREKADTLIAGFSSLMLRKRPYLTLKLGCTLDGRIADAGGSSQWITGSRARSAVQRMRRASDAVMVGIGTVLADDPSLRCRLRGARTGRRVVIDPHGKLPLDSQLLTDGFSHETTVVVGSDCPETVWRKFKDAGADCWLLNLNHNGHFDGAELMRRMGDAGWMRVLCEGGSGLAGVLLDDGVVDEVVVFSAPCILGGAALPAAGGEGSSLEKIRRGRFAEVRRVGDDVMLRLLFDGDSV